MQLQTYAPSLMRFPGRFSGLACLAVAAAGLAPLAMAIWGPGALDPSASDVWSALKLYQRVASPTLLAVNALGALPLLLACVQGLGWLTDRLAEGLAGLGLAWSDARAVPTALLALAAAALFWAMVLVDGANTLDALHESFRRRAEPVWPKLAAALAREAPPDEVPLPDADPLPALRRLLDYPAVGLAYHVSPAGRLTIVQRGGEPEVVELASWRPRRMALDWIREDPATRRADRHDRLVDLVAFGNGSQARYAGTGRGFYPRDDRGVDDRDGSNLFEEHGPDRARLGYGLAKDFAIRVLDPYVREAGLDGHVLVGYRYRPSLAAETVVLVDPQHFRSYWPRFSIAIDGFTQRTIQEEGLYQARVALFGLALALATVLIDLLRRLRLMWADRAIALAQSNFVSGVSHEMRTPLATIKLYAELTQAGLAKDPASQAEFMGTITQECDRLSRLIENVLDFSRISGRRRGYVFEPVAAEALLDEALAAVAGPLASSGLALQRHVPTGLTFKADRDGIVQALVNLLSNAIKYAAQGGAVLVAFRPAGPGWLAIEVRDFGPGIPEAERKRVFQPFYRVGNELTRTATGSGLGLALVSEHVKAHGGRVELESPPGGGTTFRLLLPLDPTLKGATA